jgi:hypothetical protein
LLSTRFEVVMTAWVGARTTQVLLGHGWFGEYYKRFNLNNDHTCSCGAETQTREHLLCDCPLFDAHRRPWRRTWRRIAGGPTTEGLVDLSKPTTGFILGSDFRDHLVVFLRESDAFFKGAVK